MSRHAVLMAVAGVGAVALILGTGLYLNRGARVILEGKIQKVRVQAIDDQNTAVIVDFRATNPAKYDSMVGSVSVEVDSVGGTTLTGTAVADADAQRFLEAFPLLGPKYNPSLVTRERIKPGQTVDRMTAVRLEAPEAVVNSRKAIRVRILDIDGPVSVID